MIKKTLFFAAFLFFQTVFSQNSDFIYYDKEWKETTKENAAFYRKIPLKKVGNLVLIKDFYIDGKPQFEGYTLENDENKYVGDIIWYDENGNDDSFRQYKNDSKITSLNYYQNDGKIRKAVHYKNGFKDGETTIFDKKGAVLMKGIYAKGKPVSGDFETLSDEYETNYSELQNTPQTTEVMTDSSDGNITTLTSKPSKKTSTKTVSQKIFWANTNKPAQETVYRIDVYTNFPVEQKNYDKTGKLIQTISENQFQEYSKNIINGKEFQYYLHNNFATEIKSVTTFLNGEMEGKSISYFPSGEVFSETPYKNGLKDGEEILFAKNGTITAKRIFKKMKHLKEILMKQLVI
ncbi:toxin-antitoxin system YwqK family antitoxin [Halpernia frigidisoli]|uniref:Antitoxin component YwqK of the YwqJK toxin-antitoxin module n=1 Tax=Halpernia frigidisoli TaxID=1125876 RepID=A0A1I3HPR6_9FLAO|nr:hypothetical protein [Halpernia frigidisoli]SFI37724.1 Antitoxin component YwqK of the YwqJK toxin-antitoxin module [Halpernia frigidisoli]